MRNSYLSVDPYMRGRMRDMKSYIPPFQVGEVLQGGAVGQVVASNGAELQEGAWVQSQNGWREHYTSDGTGLLPVDPDVAPVSTALGVLGMPGLTAWYGLTQIGDPKEGETVFVSAAAGAVGSVVGQLARLRGARAVGSAGSPEKVAYLTDELGFDAAFDYKQEDLNAALREHCPDGIDVYFDNVGGDHLEAALNRLEHLRPRAPVRDGLRLQPRGAPARPAQPRVAAGEPRDDHRLHHHRPLRPLQGVRAGGGRLRGRRRAALPRDRRGRHRAHARGLHRPAAGREHRQDARARGP